MVKHLVLVEKVVLVAEVAAEVVAIPGNGTGAGGGTPNSVSPPIGWGNNGGQNNGNEPYCAGGGGG